MTTLSGLLQTLPNGLHDAELRTYTVDLSEGRLAMELQVWVGDIEDTSRREAYRPARLELGGVKYLGIDPPGPGASWMEPPSIRTDVGFEPPKRAASCPPEPPAGSFRAWFWLDELNTFMHVVAETAALQWQGEEWVRQAKSEGPENKSRNQKDGQ